jgi:hypothetical protein
LHRDRFVGGRHTIVYMTPERSSVATPPEPLLSKAKGKSKKDTGAAEIGLSSASVCFFLLPFSLGG